MSHSPADHGFEGERGDAVRALEAEFGELINHVRRMIADAAERVSPGMLPGAYKTFTTIVRRESVTLSALAEALMADKGQVSRTVRELEEIGLISRAPDPRDGRSSLLSPTAFGLERLEAARGSRANSPLTSVADWSIDDIHDLTRLLHALTAGVSPDTGEANEPETEATAGSSAW
jgi:DNA-binding MarR family transcriptional regulator